MTAGRCPTARNLGDPGSVIELAYLGAHGVELALLARGNEARRSDAFVADRVARGGEIVLDAFAACVIARATQSCGKLLASTAPFSIRRQSGLTNPRAKYGDVQGDSIPPASFYAASPRFYGRSDTLTAARRATRTWKLDPESA